MDVEDNRLPLTVVGGYLGSGKTTLLNYLLSGLHERRIAVIVNDFGSINIDASMIEHQDGDVVNLANGCICCTLAIGLIQCLFMLANRSPRPDHVVIEASGVADPYKIAQYGHVPPYRLDGVIVLADAETVRERAKDKYVGPTVIRQLKAADMIVLNKVDLVSQEQLEQVRQWLLDLVPEAHLIPVKNAQAPLPLLLDLRHGGPPGTTDEASEHNHPLDYDTWSYRSEHPVTRATLSALLSVLSSSILRAKGFIYLVEDPEHRHRFQMVGKRWSENVDRLWGNETPATQFVIIGLPGTIDRSQLEQILTQPKASLPNPQVARGVS